MLFNKNKIDFIVIGVQKAGTTALDYYLRNHPQIQMSDKKELHFFDNDTNFQENKIDYKKYHQNFDFNIKGKIRGEITPSYIFSDNALPRIKKYNLNIKLIVLLRNPIERAYSNWNMEVLRNNEKRTFYESIENEINEINKGLHHKNIYNSYLMRGRYKDQILNIFKYIPEHNVHIIKYDDFLNNQKNKLKGIYEFLNINSSILNFEKKIKNKLEYTNKITLNEKLLLYDFFKVDTEFLENRLGWDCSDWKLHIL